MYALGWSPPPGVATLATWGLIPGLCCRAQSSGSSSRSRPSASPQHAGERPSGALLSCWRGIRRLSISAAGRQRTCGSLARRSKLLGAPAGPRAGHDTSSRTLPGPRAGRTTRVWRRSPGSASRLGRRSGPPPTRGTRDHTSLCGITNDGGRASRGVHRTACITRLARPGTDRARRLTSARLRISPVRRATSPHRTPRRSA